VAKTWRQFAETNQQIIRGAAIESGLDCVVDLGRGELQVSSARVDELLTSQQESELQRLIERGRNLGTTRIKVQFRV
jgi:hypothetical protein